MERREELDRYLTARRRDRERQAQLATGRVYRWVGDSEALAEGAAAAAAWLGDHVGHRVQVCTEVDHEPATLWLVEPEDSTGRRVGWRIRVGDLVWPLAANARCQRWTRTYSAGSPVESWSRAVLSVEQPAGARPDWPCRYQIEDCAQDPPWLDVGARLHHG